MAIGIFPKFDPPLPGVEMTSDGKFLAAKLGVLDRIAATAGVPSLTTYMDHREPDPDDDVLDLDAFAAGWADWFPAADGVRTVDGLLAALSANPAVAGAGQEPEWLAHELADLRECLADAVAHGSRFRIEVAM
ncbi:MAG: hypothetical protein ACRC7O_16810 [Fimbriiglobus sp.]